MAQSPAERLADLTLGHVLVTAIALGHRTGLLQALPGSEAEIAGRAGAAPRYVREWLGCLVAGGIVTHAAGHYAFADGYAPLLTGASPANVAPTAEMLTRLTAMAPEVAARFADGAGIPPRVYAARAGETLGEPRRHLYDAVFVSGFLAPVPGLLARLRAGARVLDVGCGTGQTTRLVAQEFGSSQVTGIDVVPEAIALAAAGAPLPNLTYEVGDAVALSGEYDVVLAVDVVHDLPRPVEALAAVRRVLVRGGVLVMVDAGFPGDLDALAGDPVAAAAYGVSLLHCLPISLDGRGAGLGAMWGRERAVATLREAGFAQVDVLPAPRPQNAVYVAS
ncbi:methyltransferase domain-containing protein [Pseudonocardia ailaonensis]|uniref:Methyltransferase domain-containing protein n=1 Tax=Pseudonocardia ailaonensis TaxID=367279 RepID=A0ABN2NT34_9PSEU